MDDLLEDATMGLKFNHLKCRANERVIMTVGHSNGGSIDLETSTAATLATD